ncbi:Stage V sporulation protein K [Pleurostoma richardsiae]|uniref:Stage V sporulation protein K n=1 Tax=Pleurostoma richardsiae TaxID=41990 RepID=A0AA38VZZ3_9PEZI|nr:Stage V sporulation protein K [Pleurostoma richardsiae]
MTIIPQSLARAGRLTALFWGVLNGDRPILTSADAQLFIEAVESQQPPAPSVEKIISSKHGVEGIYLCVRVNLSPSFIKAHSLKLLNYLSDPGIKALADGQFLQQLLLSVVTPRMFWDALVVLVRKQELPEEGLATFAWLSLSLLSLTGTQEAGVFEDIQAISLTDAFTKATTPETRMLGYKIQGVLRLRFASATGDAAYGPGGRHDNDFADFRKISIYPTADEFLSPDRPFYRHAKEVQEHDMATRAGVHIDNQFRLFREDMLGELRNDLQVAIGRKKGKGNAILLRELSPVGLYLGDEKHFKSCAIAVRCGRGLEVLARMNTKERTKYLDDNKHFLKHQAFGALCRGEEIVGFAFIDRDTSRLMQTPPEVLLRFVDEQAFMKGLMALKSPVNLQFVVVGTPVFAYEPVLRCLKDISDLPLQDRLLDPRSSDTFQAVFEIQSLIQRLLLKGAGGELDFVSQGGKATQVELDPSQLESLVNALSTSVSAIQGPPGTGKSFIGALISKCLYAHTDLKILVISYTNHALDQFLEDLNEIGIPAGRMVRLGSKYSDKTKPMLLSEQRSEYRRTFQSRAIMDNLKHELTQCAGDLQCAFAEFVGLHISPRILRDYLEFDEDDRRFFDAFQVPTDERDWKRVGKKGRQVTEDYLYQQWKGGDDPGIFKQQAYRPFKDIWDMDSIARQNHINKWTQAIIRERANLLQRLAGGFNANQECLNDLYNENKADVIRQKRIIGCTTTGAAMFIKLIRSFNPDVVLVEEAGEILESHVLTALAPSVKQLILIGDHKQLRPKVNNYSLTVEKGDGFDLNRSLFERLILQGQPHTTLQKQHRAHPDISVLYRELTYPDLLDSPKTLRHPPIRGLQDRVNFVNHNHLEVTLDRVVDRRDPDTKMSKKNVFEAEMVLKCVKYLSQQGYGTKDMVVLTPYLGQLHLLRDKLSEEIDPWLSDIDAFDLIRAGLMTQAAAKVDKGKLRLSTIDNYQGEESDIVIVSLTRSNQAGDIGFMSAPERLNVLLSRARNCIIMIGNMDTFMSSKKGKDAWVPLFESLKKKGHLYDGLPVKCEKHPEKKFLLGRPIDFETCCPDGGCAEPCGVMLKCGVHKCALRCHRITDHSMIDCLQPIEKTCTRQHRRKVPCSKQKDGCKKCVQEDKETERRIKRDLALEAERKAREAAYARELQEMKDEIDHQRRIIKYQQDDEEQKKTLAQHRADLEGLQQTAARTQKMRQQKGAAKQLETAAAEQSVASSVSDANGTTKQDQGSGLELPSTAKEEWAHLKQFEGASSKPLDELMGMIGLEEVKSEFLSIKSRVDTAIRQDISLERERFSCSLLGNPGTGKTTVARVYGRFLTSVGVIPGACFEESTGASLANMGVSGCKSLVEKILDDGGGVLFIDEAYQLTSGNNPGGGAVLDYLLAEVENLTGKIVFVLAGYNKQMESFFAHNPGLPSRFPLQMKFADYTDDELLRIFELNVNKKYRAKMKCEDGLRGLYCRIVSRRIGRGRGREGFGNARAVENTLAIISRRQSDRLRKDRRSGAKPDDLLLTKVDLIGPEPSEALTKSDAWRELQRMLGLKAVKEAVKSLVDSVRQNYERELLEQPPIEYSLNKVFLGSPGTGKTTVAKLYGAILTDLGLLSKGEVVPKNPADFVGSVLGQSEQQTKGILAACEGKVLVIDEAYGLYGGGGSQGAPSDPYKTAVIDTIVAEVQSVPGDDRCVLLLGYKDQMETMFQNVNPGLSRRFPISSAFEFEDFDQDDLRKILDLKLKAQGYEATDQAKRVTMEMLGRARARPNFGNAGEVDILLDKAKGRHQARYSRREAKLPSTLEAIDFDEDFDRAERSETNIRKLFEGTVGCEATVALVEGYQETVKTLKALDMDPKESIPFNFLFRGPPGTGKTTTAKKMGKVFYDMGFLATAEVEECSATDLIGQYVGQTGPKVQQLLDKALGRVLFIDEAYRLADGGFAKEAMDELVDSTTKAKYFKKLVIILAGYENDINRLMSMNPGLTSRFPETIEFRSLSPGECTMLLTDRLKGQQKRLKAKKVALDLSALEQPGQLFQGKLFHLFQDLSAQDNWASARDVHTLAQAIFNKAIKAPGAVASGYVTVDEASVVAELQRMLTERVSRGMSARASSNSPSTVSPPLMDMLCGTPPKVSTTTKSASSEVKEEPPNEQRQTLPDYEAADEGHGPDRATSAVRDAGVSDAVWEQLQRDKRAEEEREEEYRRLQEASRRAREEDRAKIVEKLLQEEARRKREAEIRQKLKMMGACPVGFSWIKESGGGYRCAGGSHYISDAALGTMGV